MSQIFGIPTSNFSTETSQQRIISPTRKQGRTSKKHSNSQSKSRHTRPVNIKLPVSNSHCEALITPSLSATWSRSSFGEAMLTPICSPEGTLASFWGPGEGSVVSSTSSCDSRERLSSRARTKKLERPLVGCPRDSRERCMSVSLVVGSDGVAQVQREEVEVEFLENQKELGLGSASMMQRMVSSAGSDASVSRTFRNMSLVNSTRGEVLVRSSSQQTDLSHSIPLTPNTADSVKFVSPIHLRSADMGMRRTVSLLPTPESCKWNDSEDEDETRSLPNEDHDDAQSAVQKLFDRKQGRVAQGFIGCNMPTSPMAVPRISSNMNTCSACQIVFRSSFALADHTPKCSVKQTPFASADFFDSLDMFDLSDDLLLMNHLSSKEEQLPPLQFGNLLESVAIEDEIIQEPSFVDLSSSNKRSRFSRLPPMPSTPTRSKSSPAIPTLKRQKIGA